MFRFESVYHTKQTAGTVQCNDMSVQHSTVQCNDMSVQHSTVVILCSFMRAEEVNTPATVLRSVA